jgi:anti-sigma B factor antagonist
MADFKMQERQVGEITVLDFIGNITFGKGCLALHQGVERLIEEGRRNILLNFEKADYVDSSAIGELVAGYTLVKRSGGQLKLLNLTSNMKALLALTQLLTFFEVYDNEPAAILSYA